MFDVVNLCSVEVSQKTFQIIVYKIIIILQFKKKNQRCVLGCLKKTGLKRNMI